MELINLEFEEKVLRGILYDKDLMLRLLKSGNIPNKIFADKSFRKIFSISKKYFIKNNSIIPQNVLKSHINRISEKVKDSKIFKEKLYSVIDKLYEYKPGKKSKSNFNTYIEELILLWKGREIQDFNMGLYNSIDSSDLDEAINLVSNFKIPSFSDDIESGEYTETFLNRERTIIDKIENPEKYQLYETGIIELDEALGGGIGKEFVVIAGSSNAGKSFALQYMAANGKRMGKNVLLFTIEMQHEETCNRIDCNLCNIPHKFFRNPVKNYNKDIHNKWKSKINLWNKKPGKLQVVSFKKNVTMELIESKVYEIMSEWGEPIDAIFIDYLDDIEPKKQYKESKDWRSFGEISWDMHMMAKFFKNIDGTDGIPIITANQLKKTSKSVSKQDKNEDNKRLLDERDTGSSPLPFRHSDVYIGITTIDENILSALVIMKGRATGKPSPIGVYHDFEYGRFHSDRKKIEFEESINNLPESDEIKELELEEEE